MNIRLDERQSAEQGMFDNVTTRINTLLGKIVPACKEAKAAKKKIKLKGLQFWL